MVDRKIGIWSIVWGDTGKRNLEVLGKDNVSLSVAVVVEKATLE
jgi:hypothetical protein